jgi:hypothetical protein
MVAPWALGVYPWEKWLIVLLGVLCLLVTLVALVRRRWTAAPAGPILFVGLVLFYIGARFLVGGMIIYGVGLDAAKATFVAVFLGLGGLLIYVAWRLLSPLREDLGPTPRPGPRCEAGPENRRAS